MKIVAVIPARGGSKGLKDKNIKMIHGKPLIAWTIEAALESVYIDRLIVTTDCERIASIAKEYGAEVPFIRPANLATDEAAGIAPVLHAIEFLEKHEYSADYTMLLQCTSPLRRTIHIDESIEIFLNESVDSLTSVSELEHPPLWNRMIDKEGFLQHFIEYDEKGKYQRQDFKKVYRLNGAIYIANTEKLKKEQSFFVGNVKPYLMSKQDSIDIDDEFDFEVASTFLGLRLNGEQ